MTKTAYDLVEEMKQVENELSNLLSKTNGHMGKHDSIWNSISVKQKRIKEIKERLESIKIKNDEIDFNKGLEYLYGKLKEVESEMGELDGRKLKLLEMQSEILEELEQKYGIDIL